jgi:hypothetical protein
MRHLTHERLLELLTLHEPPCVSLYQRTYRHSPDNAEDPIRYRNLSRDLRQRLEQAFPGPHVKPLLERFRALEGERDFWIHRTDGLALLASPERFEVIDLQRPVADRVVVSDSFYVKPLLRSLQSADRFQVLGLTRHEARFFEGNRYVLDPIELDGVPLTIQEVLGDELTDPHLTVASYGMKGGRVGGGEGPGSRAMHHGHGGKADEVDVDMERFFRAIDRTVIEHLSKPSGLPLLLAALPEYHTPFRELSHNPQLLEAGIDGNPLAFDADTLREKAWEVLEPRYRARLSALVERYGSARARDLGADEIESVARAAVDGRVDVLLVEADRHEPGRIGAASGEIEAGSATYPEADDLLDDLAEAVLRTKGEVVVVPAERMPTETGVAAIFRY